VTTAHWTDQEFADLSWHDNHIHGFRILEGEDGTGELLLDIDFILQWLCDAESKECTFRIAPATLAFRQVSDLRITLDYVSESAVVAPVSIGEIRREPRVYPNGFSSYHWRIELNWPSGLIEFEASGFSQELRAEPVLTDVQFLPGRQRA
jgi:hypothetical protein